MNEGVQILLERMKTHPEEFVSEPAYGESKWSAIVSYFKGFLDEEDMKTLMDAWQENTRKVMQERFTQEVIKELVDPKSDKGKYGDSVLDAQVYSQQAARMKEIIEAQRAQAQQAPNPYNSLGSAGQGLLGSLFGGSK